jgi:probable rRNA maturation factor
MLNFSLQFADKRHKTLLPRHRIKRWVKAAFNLAKAAEDTEPATITLRLVDEAEGRELNRSFRQKDYATNVLTFDYSHAPCTADIVICCPVIDKEAMEQHKTLEAHYAHMVVHGVLHALGYDHVRARDAKLMEALEVQVLQTLNIANPYS